jgi:hypothetical protein
MLLSQVPSPARFEILFLLPSYYHLIQAVYLS